MKDSSDFIRELSNTNLRLMLREDHEISKMPEPYKASVSNNMKTCLNFEDGLYGDKIRAVSDAIKREVLTRIIKDTL